jgi:hypothetical protein
MTAKQFSECNWLGVKKNRTLELARVTPVDVLPLKDHQAEPLGIVTPLQLHIEYTAERLVCNLGLSVDNIETIILGFLSVCLSIRSDSSTFVGWLQG